jgi:hypothetical protein
MNVQFLKGTACGICVLAAVIASADAVQVTVNGNPVSFPDAQPQMVNGRVLVPLRGVFEAIGATVLWDPSTQSISASSGRRHVKLRIGDNEANVDGKIVEMDTPPEITAGSTLVPLRFLSQSLGAHVDWEPQQDLVAVTTFRDGGHAQQFQQPPIVAQGNPGWDRTAHARPDPRYVITSFTVIPLRLDQTLTSDGNRDGDSISATVRGDSDGYLNLPRGTQIVGIVRHAVPAGGNRPGQLDVRFTALILPDGNRYPVYGTVTQLSDPNIIKTGNGRFIAKNNEDVKNNIGTDAAIGAGAGLVLGSFHARAIRGAAIGGVLGAIVGAFSSPHHDSNVRIPQGTRLGLILSRDLTVDRRDLR